MPLLGSIHITVRPNNPLHSRSQGLKSAPGSTPLFHFACTAPHTSLWETHPTYIQFKSILLDFFRGVEMDAVALKGLERVISVTIGGSPAVDAQLAADEVARAAEGGKGKEVESLIHPDRLRQKDYDEDKNLPLVHFRTYTVQFMRSGLPTPIVNLAPHGPHFSFEMRRTQQPDADVWKAAMKKTVKKSTNGPKKNKNVDVDEMGDKVGRVYVDNQDLSKLQARKFKGLKRKPEEKDKSEAKVGAEGEGVASGEGRKRTKA